MNARNRFDWPTTAMYLAYDIAKYRSEDPYEQVGAVAIKKDGSIILGYNGAPAGVNIDWSDRDERRKRVLHAESNVLTFCLPGEVSILAVNLLPCPECIKVIAQKKIKTVYYSRSVDRWAELTNTLAKEFKVRLIELNLKTPACNITNLDDTRSCNRKQRKNKRSKAS